MKTKESQKIDELERRINFLENQWVRSTVKEKLAKYNEDKRPFWIQNLPIFVMFGMIIFGILMLFLVGGF